jgi:hypothetical protein
MQFINNTGFRFGWAFAAGLATFVICTSLSVVLAVCLDWAGAGGSFVGYFPPYPPGTPFRGAVWLYYVAAILYWVGLGGLAFAFTVGAFGKKTATLPRPDDAKSSTRWNAQLTPLTVIIFSLIPVLFMFIWFGGIVPRLSALLKPLEGTSPFLYDVLEMLARVLVVPWSFGAMIFALYLYQRRWNRLHSQPNRVS